MVTTERALLSSDNSYSEVFVFFFQQLLKFSWIYIRIMCFKIRILDGEYIIKVSRGIVKHVYKVIPCRFLKVRQNSSHNYIKIYPSTANGA